MYWRKSWLYKFFKFKFKFKKPPKKKILIYDRRSNISAELLFKKKDYEFLDVRYESVNLYVLFLTFKRFGFKNLRDNYKKCYIELVNPKLVYTAIDNNPSFYLLKSFYSRSTYIVDQNGMRDNKFFDSCKKIIKYQSKKLKADHIFLFGNDEKKRFLKIIKANIHCLGNTKNNHYFARKRKNFSKIKSIMFIPSGTYYGDTFKNDKIIFSHLNKFCLKKGISLSICSRSGPSKEKFYIKNFAQGKWIYIPQINVRKTYEYLNSQQMVVFAHSTLGYEAMSKGIKCAVFYENFPAREHYVKYPKSGIFWNNSKHYYDIEKTLNKVIRISNKNWNKIVKKYSSEILKYDAKNLRKNKIIKEALK